MQRKIAIVTGASSGMGRETAAQLYRKYSSLQEIWLISRSRKKLADTAALCGSKGKILPLDLTEPEDRKKLLQLLSQEKPKVCYLANAAGIGYMGNFSEMQTQEITGMTELNVAALTEVTHMILPYLTEGAKILNFSSASAFLPQPGFGVYAATKSYVLSFSRFLKKELKCRKISVTAVCPGPVDTAFFEIAETYQKVPAYKRIFFQKPEKVVALAIRHAAKGKSVSVCGYGMKAFRILTKIIPHQLILDLLF